MTTEAAPLFALPHIVGLGVEKCGTTSLVELLSRVPGILVPRRKETFFFNRHFEAGADWYRGLFPAAAGARAFLDFTPSYFRSPAALERLAAFPTRKKLLLLIRHPVQRAYSHYLHDLDNHIAQGEGPARDFAQPVRADFARYAALPEHHFFTRYAGVIETLRRRFGPAALLVLPLDLLERAPEQALRRLENFLELDLAAVRGAPPIRLNRSCLPRYLMPARPRLLWQAGRPRRLRAGHLYLLRREGVLDLGVRDAAALAVAAGLQASFTRRVTQAECEALHRAHFAADVARTAALTGLDLAAWERQVDLVADEVRPGRLALW
jgi:hypothetical protein